MRNLLIALNVFLLLAIVGLALFWHPASDPRPLPGAGGISELALVDRPAGGDFTLDGPHGEVSLRDFRGRLVLLQFGYTYCPDICPTALVVVAQALAELSPEERARIQVLFVSVDPERDDVQRLAAYTAFFHPEILGLSGSIPRLAEMASRYGAMFIRQENVSAGGYVIDHTASTYLVDAVGRLVAVLPHATAPEQLLAEIRKHLPTS